MYEYSRRLRLISKHLLMKIEDRFRYCNPRNFEIEIFNFSIKIKIKFQSSRK